MRYCEFSSKTDSIDEGWKQKAAAGAIGAALTLGSLPLLQKTADTTHQRTASGTITQMLTRPEQLKGILIKTATESGLNKQDIRHLLAQTAHETLDFTRMIESGTKQYFKKYDIQFNPKKAKSLGNIKPGDGELFKGRGFIHLTGRENYRRAGEALGIPLEENPDLAASPPIAAQIAIWYWNTRVKPKLKNSNATVKQITKSINPGMKGLKSREQKFANLGDINES